MCLVCLVGVGLVCFCLVFFFCALAFLAYWPVVPKYGSLSSHILTAAIVMMSAAHDQKKYIHSYCRWRCTIIPVYTFTLSFSPSTFGFSPKIRTPSHIISIYIMMMMMMLMLMLLLLLLMMLMMLMVTTMLMRMRMTPMNMNSNININTKAIDED